MGTEVMEKGKQMGKETGSNDGLYGDVSIDCTLWNSVPKVRSGL